MENYMLYSHVSEIQSNLLSYTYCRRAKISCSPVLPSHFFLIIEYFFHTYPQKLLHMLFAKMHERRYICAWLTLQLTVYLHMIFMDPCFFHTLHTYLLVWVFLFNSLHLICKTFSFQITFHIFRAVQFNCSSELQTFLAFSSFSLLLCKAVGEIKILDAKNKSLLL